MWKLVIEDDEGKRTVVPLSRDDYSVGRKEGNTIRLTERNISRDHARLVRKPASTGGGETYVLEDKESYNGVHVNGLRVAEPTELQHGDLIQLGDYRIVYQDESMTEATAPYVPVSEVEASRKTMPMANAFRGSLLMERPTRLVMLVGPTPGVEFPLDPELTTVGRAEDCHVSVDHNSVSRLHCEIHTLGEGRYEIMDKGSSNGVRVNGADLRRGIIEAGDLIELGDVRFKFVGAGQVFIPGANESQQLTAISDRQVEFASKRPDAAKGSVVPSMVLGAVVATALVVGGYLAISREPTPPAKPVAAADAVMEYELGKLKEAQAICAKGPATPACDDAHSTTNREIREASAVRVTPEYRAFEAQWAEGMLTRAETADAATKRGLLTRVEATTSLDPSLRAKATALLAAGQPTPSASATESAPPPASASAPPTPPTAEPTTTAAPPPTTPPTPTGPTAALAPTTPPPATAPATPGTTAAPKPTVKPPPTNPLDAAIKAGDWATVKGLLLPRQGSLDCSGLYTLKQACRATGDTGCAKSTGDLRVAKKCQ
ncbi:MAG TPA: FHA domain-containing protein [Polyangiaceae bacterium]|nr:FHA domain-containing protein [Polyangiaceae bacterium]